MNYEAVIGLEVHVHLATNSKLFCSCSTKFGQAANSSVCEVCGGMPGALPVPNRQAIKLAAIIGLATNCHINLISRFARKNYFYPDLPAGYQISQFDLPICTHGYLDIGQGGVSRKIGITRIHMENDAGKNMHSQGENLSFVDLNRAGTPLVEIVSEPDMRSGSEAVEYLKRLHELVTWLGVSDGNMEEGSFRCDANVSIRPAGSQKLGTRAELKNLNSFKFVQKAIDYEIERQEDLLISGKEVIQETRLYDSGKNITQSMRSKEEAQDYRYFPDPDLLPVEISAADLAEWRQNLPELPQTRRERLIGRYELNENEALFVTQNIALAEFFEKACQRADAKKIINLLMGPCLRECNARNIAVNPAAWPIQPETLASLTRIVEEGLINAKTAVDIFPEIFAGNEDPRAYVEKHGLIQISDSGYIEETVDKVLQENPEEVEAYKNGKKKLLSFLVGQVMRQTRGKANPAMVNELINKKIQG